MITSNLPTTEKLMETFAVFEPSKTANSTMSALKKEDVIKYFGQNLNFVTNDFGYYAENLESTIIRYENGWHVLRQGVVKIG